MAKAKVVKPEKSGKPETPRTTDEVTKPASTMDTLLMSIHDINMNPYLLGIAYIMLNLGGRFMVLSITPAQEAFLQNIVFRPLLLFCIMFIGTRNLVVAFWLTLAILIILHYLLNEQSDWYLLKAYDARP